MSSVFHANIQISHEEDACLEKISEYLQKVFNNPEMSNFLYQHGLMLDGFEILGVNEF